MNEQPKQITIHLSRIGKSERTYLEGFVEDNGFRLKTLSIVPEAVGLHLSEKFCNLGRIPKDRLIHSVLKHHFYNEFFSIVEYRDEANEILGFYCDIVTPLQRQGDEYFLTDLILDIWVYPDYRAVELDRDEFEAAVSDGSFPAGCIREALETCNRLKAEIEKGIFPGRYLA